MRGRTGGAPSTRNFKLVYYYVRLLVVLLVSTTSRGQRGAPYRRSATRTGRGRSVSTEAHILIIVLAAAVIAFIVHLVRSRRLRAKYSVLWFSIGLGLAVLAIFPDLLVWVSDLFGIGYPPATFMLLALSFLLVLVLHFSWELSRLEDRTRALAEEHALLREEVEERLGPRDAG